MFSVRHGECEGLEHERVWKICNRVTRLETGLMERHGRKGVGKVLRPIT